MNHFLITSDISHKVHTQDLMKQDWCDLVKAIEYRDVELESDHKHGLEMDICIADACRLYRHDISTQLVILYKKGKNVISVTDSIAIPDIINPLLGGKTRVLKSGLVTESQYGAAVDALLAEMQQMR